MKLHKSSLLAAAAFLLCTAAVRAQVTAIKAGKLVDPDSGTTAINQVIIVEGGKIKSVGTGVPIPANATVIDLSQSTVLPGLFDAHSHMCQTTSPENRDLFTTDISQPTSYRAIWA